MTPEPADVVVVVEWRRAGGSIWHIVRGAPGETFDEVARYLRREHADCAEVRER